MAEYIIPPVETDPDVLEQNAVAFLQAEFPGWEANEAALATWQIRAIAQMVATARDLAADVPLAVFMYYGATIAGIPPEEAQAATVTSTWTMRDSAGPYTIPAGLEVAIEDSAGELHEFEVVDTVIVPNGQTVTGAGAVQLIAITPGAASSDISGTVQLLEPLDYVTGVALTGPTAGGADGETVEDYVNRLTTELQLLSPRAILPRDFEVLAQRVATVHRAVALDGYNPADQTFNNERMVTIAAVKEDGTAVSAGTKTAIEAELEAKREVNFIVHVIDPTYTAVDVTFVAVALPGYEAADVETRAEAAAAAYLSPAAWGVPRYGDQTSWLNQDKVRLFEMAEALNRVEGLDYLTTLTMRTGANPHAASDITLTGAVPMPTAGTITGTVTDA